MKWNIGDLSGTDAQVKTNIGKQLRAFVEQYLDKQRFAFFQVWPYTVRAPQPSKSEFENDSNTYITITKVLRQWAQSHDCQYTEVFRLQGANCGKTTLVKDIAVPDERTALRIASRECASRYRITRRRLRCLREEFNASDEAVVKVVRKLDDATDLDFDLVRQAAHYFAEHDVSGMSPRAVPIPGFSTKWLGGKSSERRKAICLLLGRDALDFKERPGEIRLRYLDPAHRGYPDLYVTEPWSNADCAGLDYAVIVENKDTYQEMPEIENGLCIFGNGRAANRIAALLPWIADIPHVIYWGDMDADGLEILSEVRESGIDCESLFMDVKSYTRYERFGTAYTPKGERLKSRNPAEVPGLREDERALYESLCSGEGVNYLRIEQERIPIVDAVERLRAFGFPIAG